MRRVHIVPAFLALTVLSANATVSGHGGGGGGHGGGGHSGGGMGHHSTGAFSGSHGGGRLPTISGGNGVPWNQPVMQPDQLPEAKLARFVHHVFHPQG